MILCSRISCFVFQWKVGDHCLAIFTEDDVVYEAEIRSVDPEAGTCIVRYQGYGNEEEHQLDHLQPIRRPRSQLSHEHVSEVRTDRIVYQKYVAQGQIQDFCVHVGFFRFVRYQGYRNEEEHQLDHLQPIRRPRSQLSHVHISEVRRQNCISRVYSFGFLCI